MVDLADIQAYAHEIARRFKPQRIILFGSHADGEPDEDSDVDLLVVIADGGDPLGKAMEISRALPHYGFALDLIVRDPDVLQRRIEQHDWFLIDITEKGRVLYEAQQPRVG
ncbi:MAG: nucleotidyltransferase domain-containing protein [Planctomycetes bacterium]|nr:nucleotidyltransferase domain-containing protein [Planctomycetota bacterium]